VYFGANAEIFFVSGKFLMAEGPLLNDKSKRVVCLKRENSTDMQLWKVEPALKKIKMENFDVPME
jgi:hypothetical protein